MLGPGRAARRDRSIGTSQRGRRLLPHFDVSRYVQQTSSFSVKSNWKTRRGCLGPARACVPSTDSFASNCGCPCELLQASLKHDPVASWPHWLVHDAEGVTHDNEGFPFWTWGALRVSSKMAVRPVAGGRVTRPLASDRGVWTFAFPPSPLTP